ncbi:MAG: PorT family protein [Sphingobacteriia bacterium]|nr:MAG: PorT family protein [Sphingobacteriia bacterium]
MRKSFLLFCVLGLLAFQSQAQVKFRAGVKGGLNLNQIEGQAFENGADYSFHLGGFAEIDFLKKIGIQPEVLWNQTTTQRFTTLPNIYQTLPQNITLNYLSIPILFRYNWFSFLTLHAGPQFGVLLNKEKNLLQNGEAAFSSGDMALVLGAQVNLKSLRVYGRYNAGLSNMNDAFSQDKWKSRQWQLGIGIKL